MSPKPEPVTLTVLQWSRSLLNELAPSNILYMVVTLLVSHALSSWSNALSYWNM